MEDELIFAEDLMETLLSFGYMVSGIAPDGKDAVAQAAASRPDLILLDINLGSGPDGIETAQRILSEMSVPIIFLTAYAQSQLLERAKATLPYGYIIKPCTNEELQSAVKIALWKYTKDEQLRSAKDTLEQRIAERTAEMELIRQELRKNEKLYRDLTNSISDIFFALDNSLVFTFWNPASEQLTGVPAKDAVGKSFSEVFPSERGFAAERLFLEIIRTQQPKTSESTLNVRNGDFTFEIHGYPSAGGVAVFIKDITERKQMEDALRKSEERYRAVVENQTELICRFSPDGRLTFVNDAYCRYFGLDKTRCLEKPHPLTLPTEDAMLMRQYLAALTPENPVGTIEHRIIMSSGEVRWQRWSDRAIFSNDDRVIEYQSVGRDITELILSEETLRDNENLFREVFNNANDAVFLYEMQPERPGRFIQVNDVAIGWLGYSLEELQEMSPRDIVPEHVQKKTLQNIMATLHTYGHATFTSLHKRKDSSTYPVEVSTHTFLYKGRLVALSHVRDITERKMVEEEIKKNQKNLEKLVSERTVELTRINRKLKKEINERTEVEKKLIVSGKEKDLLLREVHHRVKNNLQLIIGLIDITRKRAHEPAILSILTDIIAKVQTMGLIHTRLYESKRFDKINMKQQVEDLADMISGYYSHDCVDIVTDINCAEIFLPVDLAIPCALSLNETFSNIHKHAFRGRRNGIITVSSVMNDGMIRFVVQDNGVGIPAGFDIEKSNRLGLKLIRSLIEQQLHGTVEIKSKNGTEVVLEFPVNQGGISFGSGNGS
ncbi:MAG: PAS domain S-box protein [Methanoregula sp.]|nr:PAS domain S-box protein [Methanoregula sp.]